MGLPQVTIEGRVATAPELRFIPSGAAVTNIRVATSERKMNRETNQWEDGRQCFIDVTCWRTLAENVAESFSVGDEIVVTGRLYDDSFTDREGATRQVKKVDADTVAAGLRNSTARITRSQRQQGGGQQGGQQGGQGQADPWAQAAARPPGQAAADPWAQGPSQGQQQPPQQPQQGQQQPAQQQQQQPQQGGWPQQGQPQQGQPQQGQPGGWGGQPPAYEEPPF